MISVRPTHIPQGGASAFLGETWHSGVPPAAPWPGAWLSRLVLEAAVIDSDRHHVTRNRDWDIDLGRTSSYRPRPTPLGTAAASQSTAATMPGKGG